MFTRSQSSPSASGVRREKGYFFPKLAWQRFRMVIDHDPDAPSEVKPRENSPSDASGGGGEDREQWGSRSEFLLTAVGAAVGLGNIWRFPYLCFKYGGGSFLFPYLLSLAFLGIPLFLLELGTGQLFRLGTYHSFKAIHPAFAGLGIASCCLTTVVMCYYNVIIAWSIYYFFSSFQSPLPFSGDEETASSEDFFFDCMLKRSDGFTELNGLVWPLTGTLVLGWVVVYYSLRGGVKTAGKVVWVTATSPYLFLFILLIRGVTLPGAGNGIRYFLEPDFSKLGDAEVWEMAASQIFYSLGVGWGNVVAFGSYNPKNEDVVKDTLFIGLVNSATSILAGFAVFSLLGYLAHDQGLEVEEVVTGGEGLAFIVYPQGLALLPAANVFALCFFLMLFFLGVDSQFAMVEVAMTLLMDLEVPIRRERCLMMVCVFGFLIGLLFVSHAGLHWLSLIDSYVGAVAPFGLALTECVAIGWVYGAQRFMDDIKRMTDVPVPPICYYLWRFFAPAVLFVLLVLAMDNDRTDPLEVETPDGKPVPGWVRGIGRTISYLPLVVISGCALIVMGAGFERNGGGAGGGGGWTRRAGWWALGEMVGGG